MISRLDRLQGRDIYENTALAKLNEVIDAINSLRDDCNLLMGYIAPEDKCEPTISKMENVQKETFVSIDDALKIGKAELKSIWHTSKEKPMLHRDIILCGDGWSMAIDIIPETVNNICWANVEKWCYVDDLIKENERTRKALEIAKDTIRHADWFFYGDYNVDAKTMHNEIKCVIKAITAPEQKD